MRLFFLSFVISDPDYEVEGSHLEITGNGTVTWDDIKTKTQYTKMVSCRVNEGITALGDQAFRGCSLLASISLPNSLEVISNRCFWGTAIKNLSLPRSLRIFLTTNTLYGVNFEAFYNERNNVNFRVYDDCLYTANGTVLVSVPTMKTSISFFEGIQEIGNYCFWKCRIPSVTLPDAIRKLGAQSFVDGGPNTEIIFGKESQLTKLVSSTFYSINLVHFRVPPNVVSISKMAYYNCKIVNFSFIPESNLRTLDEACFDRCSELTRVELPRSIEYINLLAFAGCIKLKSVTIEEGCRNYSATPEGILFSAGYVEVIFIPPDASGLSIPSETSGFAAGILQKLTNIDIDKVELSDLNENLEYRGGIFYSRNYASTLSAVGSIKDAVIHFNATSLAVSLFEGVEGLRSLVFEENSKCKRISKSACKGCTNLATIVIPPQVTILEQMAFYGSGLVSITIPKNTTTIQENCFQYTSKLQTVTFADGSLLSSVSSYGFESSSVVNIRLPPNLKTLGASCFQQASVQSVKIPSEMTVLASQLFMESKITECLFDEDSQLTKFQTIAFKNCRSLRRVQIPPLVTTIESACFTGCTALDTIEFIGESTIEAIPSLVFEGCTSLKSVTLPSSLQKVDASSFFGCFSLTSLETTEGSSFEFIEGCLYKESRTVLVLFVPGLTTCDVLPNAKEIGSNAFFGDSKLETIDFGEGSSLRQIGAETFYGCSNLIALRLPSSVQSIADGCFKGCSKLEEWTVCDQSILSSIGNSLFDGCASLRIAHFGKDSSLSSIGSNAFAGCVCLQAMSIPGNVSFIGSAAFHGCSNLGSVVFEHTNISKPFSIPNECFSQCQTLQFVAIPQCVRSIGSNAFHGCKSLCSIRLGEGISSLGDGAFSNSGLVRVFLPSSVVSVGSLCFFSCAFMTNFSSATLNLSLGSNCFSLCSSLRFVGICAVNPISGSTMFDGCPLTVVYTTKDYPVEKVGGLVATKVMDRCLVLPTDMFTLSPSGNFIALINTAHVLHAVDNGNE